MSNPDVKLLRMLVKRLERLSVDSHWARRASGLRGNIIKVLNEYNSGRGVEPTRLSALIQHTFDILRRAAQDIPDIEEITKNTMGGIRGKKRGSHK
jgi:hypothetical protein